MKNIFFIKDIFYNIQFKILLFVTFYIFNIVISFISLYFVTFLQKRIFTMQSGI